jgi:tRNA U38,U39,U40 pseudouridine synthase TruA
VGSLVDVGRGKLDARALENALVHRDRSLLGITAPPDGLHLDEITLDDDGREPWPSAGDLTRTSPSRSFPHRGRS